jgi:2-desacetyl-2-hydroxyethyl bacteriochlorophyllide A dehydrogenase
MQVRQVVVTGQHAVELHEAEIDESKLGQGDLIIETEVSFISAGTELANYAGKEPRVFLPNQWCTYPWKSGYANVGVVRAVGPGVDKAKVGERVFTYGNHGSTVLYNQKRLVIPVPDAIDSVTAAASRMAAVSMTALLVTEIRETPWVAVFGLGTVGNLAAQAFRARGCRVIGVDPLPARRRLANCCGIDITVGGTPEEAIGQIEELTSGRGADITVDAVGHSAVVMQAVQATARFGQVVLLGSPRASVDGNLTTLLSDVHLRMLTVRGALEWLLPIYPDTGVQPSQFSKQRMIFDWIERGVVQLEPLISHRMAPSAIKCAYDGLLHEPEGYTGVALIWH